MKNIVLKDVPMIATYCLQTKGFGLTGSRFFGNHSETSDYDFYTLTYKVNELLRLIDYSKIGILIKSPYNNSNDKCCAVVIKLYDKSNVSDYVDIQIMKDEDAFNLKSKVHEFLKLNHPLWNYLHNCIVNMPKSAAPFYWRVAYEAADKNLY